MPTKFHIFIQYYFLFNVAIMLFPLPSYCHAHQLPVPTSLQPLISRVQTLTVDQLLPVLAPLLTSTSVLSQLSPAHLAEVRQCQVEMHQPEPSSKDSQHKFLSSLALSLNVSATITNLTEPSACLAVQVGCHGNQSAHHNLVPMETSA